MQLNREALRKACYEVARNTMWDQRPVDVAQIEEVANRIFKIAEEYEEYIDGQGRDPNIITRTVLYLEHTHAIPPMQDDIHWFSDMLAALIELACPNVGASRKSEHFYQDIEEGISVARSSYASRSKT